MSEAAPAIDVRKVSIAYRRAVDPAATLKEHLIRTARRQMSYRRVWAVRDVSFTVAAGEMLGIIGHNGAGKTTLMRAVAGVLRPTEGRVIVRGHVTPVLDLATGLNPDMTGRDNIRLMSALLGRDPRDIARRSDEIADWAGLHNYIDQPVRTYSSGMVARLAFSIVTDDQPDVLLLDELLSVGDGDFQTRSMERMDRMVRSGAAAVMISHDVELLKSRSSAVLWLDGGSVAGHGDPDTTASNYLHSAASMAIP